MGIYYNPPDEVANIGKRVYSDSPGKQPRIPYGYRLFALMDRPLYKAAPDVTDPDEFRQFYDQYCEDQFVTMDLYLVKSTTLEGHLC